MKKLLHGIYFYNALDLAKEIKDGSFTEFRAVKHLIATLVLGGISFSIPISVTTEQSNIGILTAFLYLLAFIASGVICYYGVLLTYQVNNKGDGKDYFLRFAALSLPVGIQLIVLFTWIGLAIIALTFALFSIFGEFGFYAMFLITFIAGCCFTILFFIRLRNYLFIASGANE